MKKTITLLSFILIASCTTSKLMVNSLTINEKTMDTYNYYDEDSKISYQLFNDDDNLYLNLKTFDRMSIVKILKSGLIIYFDEIGKKNKTVAIEYPLHNKNFNFEQLRPQKGSNGISTFDVNQLIRSVPNDAVFINNEDVERFNLELNSTNISVKLEAIEINLEKGLTYKLKIPIREITKKPIVALENFSIGIESGKIKAPLVQSDGRPSGGGRPAGGGGGRPSGGGRPAGVGGGRPSGGGRPTNIPSDVSNIAKPISIWFNLGVLFQKD